MLRLAKSSCALAAATLAAGCGGRSSVGRSDPGGDTKDMQLDDAPPGVMFDCAAAAQRVQSPTGQITDAGVMQGVAQAYAALGVLAGAPTCKALVAGGNLDGETSCDCPAGGTATVRGPGITGEDHLQFAYDNCCFSGCCLDATGVFKNCSIDIGCGLSTGTFTCGDVPQMFSQEFCIESDGRVWLPVLFREEEFAVSGNYAPGGGGTFSVRDVRTEWDCTETDGGAGCCFPEDGGGPVAWGGGC